MADTGSTISIIKLNVNHPNTAIHKRRLSENILKRRKKKKTQTKTYVFYKKPTVNIKKETC